MPLRDHFRPPLDEQTSWDIFHGQWPAMIVQKLNSILPQRYVAGPHVRAWQLSEPSVAVETELLEVDDYEVRVFDTARQR